MFDDTRGALGGSTDVLVERTTCGRELYFALWCYTSGHGSAVTSSRRVRGGREWSFERCRRSLVSSRLEDTSGPFPRGFRSPSSRPAQVVLYRVRGQETDRSAVMPLEHNRRGNYVYRARHMRRRYTLAVANLQYALKVRANCFQ